MRLSVGYWTSRMSESDINLLIFLVEAIIVIASISKSFIFSCSFVFLRRAENLEFLEINGTLRYLMMFSSANELKSFVNLPFPRISPTLKSSERFFATFKMYVSDPP